MSAAPEGTSIEAQRAKSMLLYRETTAPGLVMEVDLKRVLISTQSEFQKIDVLDTYFGKFDEAAYHETLVHASMIKVVDSTGGNGPKTVFIGGGGELATAREVLRYKSVERVIMVDLDKKVVDVCKEYLPEWGGETVLNDPRFELVIGDAMAYLMNTKESFDVMIMDISDPIEAGPGIMLYTKEFYEHAKQLLNKPHGVFVTQAGMAESVPAKLAGMDLTDPSCFAPIRNTLRIAFDCVLPYSSNIPSFSSDWGFIMAFQAPENDSTACERAWAYPKIEHIDALVDKALTGGSQSLEFYDGMTHVRCFSLTKPLRKLLREDQRIMTKDNPIYMY